MNLLTASEAAERIGMNRWTFYRYVKQQQIRYFQKLTSRGHALLFREADVDAFAKRWRERREER